MDRENCRRMVLLQGLGCSEQVPKGATCCDGCGVEIPYPRLDIFQAASGSKRKRRRKAHCIDKDATDRLKNRLKEGRMSVLAEKPAYQMIGANFICSDALICDICDGAEYISTIEDMNVFCLRPELKERFCDVIMDVVSELPQPKKSRRRR